MKYLTILFLAILSGCSNKEAPISEKETPIDIQYKIAFCAPALSDKVWFESDNKAPILNGLDVLNFPITTNNDTAQTYFNQGLILAYGFNHAEAARSFYYATKLDPACAMAYWGYAYVLGPNYNASMEPDNYERAYNAIQKAIALSDDNVTIKERDLIMALSKRYVKEPIDNRSALDVAYSDAMRMVFEKYPDDADVGTLYAESLMDLHPWDIWDKQGKPREWTAGILSTFDQVFAIDSMHPGAHHLYIHAVEASATPELGLLSARLYDEDLVPGAGHLVHMPAHIYIRTGDYHKGTVSNIRSIQVDSTYLSSCYAQGTYPLTLYPHNFHFMSATATLEGNSELGILAAQKVADHANRQLMKEPGWGTIQHYYSIPYYVNVKFGKWNKILKMVNEDSTIKYPEAVRHYARGMAFIGIGDLESARNELQKLKTYAYDESFKSITIWDINSTYDLLQIAWRVLEGELYATDGEYDKSLGLLNEAVLLEDALNYEEPPDWFFSVRHHLGAVLIEAGKNQEAIQTYQDDLENLPKNGWALHGLKKAYQNLHDEEKETKVSEQLATAWAYADIDLSSSRIK